jgi:hypothetical protein
MDGYKLSCFEDANVSWWVMTHGSCEPSGAAAACSEAQCTSCVGGTCLYSANGYYLKDGKCVSCGAAHCTHCEAAGRCLACNAGYTLSITEPVNSEISANRWGTCGDGAAVLKADGPRAALTVVALCFLVA